MGFGYRLNRTRQPHTHNLKSATLLLIQSNSSAPLSNFVSSNPSSNRRLTYIQSNSAALQLFPYDSVALLFCHSKSVEPPTIFRLTNTCFNKCVEKRYKESELNMGENSCIDRCVSKYWHVTNLIGQLLGSGRPPM
ncbi:uncharacterized protein LOC115989897 [Quercus lobata]|uniref:uncharacterized protein LOC115989897 n=1 Tax=Quercus lobata TaxID=97700 RepID=UPI0012446F9B|nr:uncharacterized protein LOC115989897 [Quercus lobata]